MSGRKLTKRRSGRPYNETHEARHAAWLARQHQAGRDAARARARDAEACPGQLEPTRTFLEMTAEPPNPFRGAFMLAGAGVTLVTLLVYVFGLRVLLGAP